MKKSDVPSRQWKTVIIVVIGSALLGCASNPAPDESTPEVSIDVDRFQISCELALLRLERLIELRSSEADFPKAVLLEAIELHRLGKELYLEEEYELALEIIEEGIALVEEKSD